MIDFIKMIISNSLYALYQPIGFALVLSILFMLVWKNYSSLKEATAQWIRWFKSEREFRRMFFLVFYSVMILFRTLLNRNMWQNPLQDVIGIWGLYDAGGKLTTEVPENLSLFIPFTILLLWTYRKHIIVEEVRLTRVLWQSTKIVFLFSFTIEFLQLFLRLGTWQLDKVAYFTTTEGKEAESWGSKKTKNLLQKCGR